MKSKDSQRRYLQITEDAKIATVTINRPDKRNALSDKVLNEDLDGAFQMQERLFRSYMGSEDNHAGIDVFLKRLKSAKNR
ncbi:MAG TPA: hypothetical protein PKG60_06185 [Spirochaetota bacterium]|nr:hypothetical protein [Spirochaetota bacterium]HPS87912.1 hypothetical protein [Spirochaetota bacterium]